jgi:hypothetical protein
MQMKSIAQTVTEWLQTNSSTGKISKTVALLSMLFNNKQNRDIYLSRSTIFARARGDGEYTPLLLPRVEQSRLNSERNTSAKLHCLYGVPIDSIGRTRSKATYPYACSKVYDIRNYTQETMWGPFLRDGSGKVDWEMIEAIMIIISHNMRSYGMTRMSEFCKRLWTRPFADAVPNTYAPMIAVGDHDWSTNNEDCPVEPSNPSLSRHVPLDRTLLAEDPYNVTGTWMRVSRTLPIPTILC